MVGTRRRMRLNRLFNEFRGSALWRALKSIALLRSSLYLAIEIGKSWREPFTMTRAVVDQYFRDHMDPWRYETSPMEQQRFSDQTAMLDEVRRDERFIRGLEIGCAEGAYTEVLAGRCESLTVLDISATALARAQARCAWGNRVTFHEFDLSAEPITGTYDLIVIAGVLEYFSRRGTFRRLRKKLFDALAPGAYLLLETTRVHAVVEDAWWARLLVRGKWINNFLSGIEGLTVIKVKETETYSILLCRKAGGS